MAAKTGAKFNLPRRKFCEGPKRVFSVRMPEALIQEIERIAKLRQWDISEVVLTALDEFAQWERNSEPPRKSK